MNQLSRLNNQKIKRTIFLAKTLDHQLRQQILQYITDKEKCRVIDIYQHFQLEQSVASTQMGLLRQAGLVEGKREGQAIFYSVNKQRLKELLDLVDEFSKI